MALLGRVQQRRERRSRVRVDRARGDTPDGTLLAEPSADVLAATRRGYWAREGDQFEFCSHDGRRIYSEVIEESNDFIVAGAIEETTLALALPDEIWLLDAETSSVRRVRSPLLLEWSPGPQGERRWWRQLPRSGLCAGHLGPDPPRSRFAVQRWDRATVEPIPLGETEHLQWLDEITALAMSDDGATVCVGTASGRALVFCERAED